MLTIIPRKEFEEILKTPIQESPSPSKKEQFDFEKFKKFVSELVEPTKTEIMKYMKNTNVKFIGEGSSRITFFIPAGSVKIDSSSPCCLKIAKKEAGIAQTKAEIEIFKRYRRLPCFPKIFDYDYDYRWVISEFGTKIESNDILDFIEAWNSEILNNKQLTNSEEKNKLLMGIDRRKNPSEKIKPESALYQFNEILILALLFSKNVDVPKEYDLSDDANWYLNHIIKPIVKNQPRFQSILGLIEFGLKDGWKEVIYEDFFNEDNWAVVFRNNSFVPLPIDWGFTEEVADEYY